MDPSQAVHLSLREEYSIEAPLCDVSETIMRILTKHVIDVIVIHTESSVEDEILFLEGIN
jgi:hypothetical protein